MIKAVLLALLAFGGPLQAQLIYVCAQEGMVGMSGSCCYDQNETPLSSDCDTNAAGTAPCMELAVTDDVDQSARSQAPTERDDSRDPPPATGPPPTDPLPAPIWQPLARSAAPAAVPLGGGTDIYLLTQRLRI